uniref:PS II complex 12 kDa extrinsic protein n=1 Tax=Corethron hystrix TaxID=216773 RepID=A0A7S1BXE9_9STRA|mmetsp:Transcript_4489/g.8743  ORF Transcript_4489/g.8743 Transcript_4489/m.8743 type:complete len:135 (+) Transcript_4489:199-603(+)
MFKKIFLAVAFMALASTANCFSLTTSVIAQSSLTGGSNFAGFQRVPSTAARAVSRQYKTTISMAKVAKIGVFSPAVYAAKFALGTPKLNQFRGKAISLHSQAIGEFTSWAGAGHLRTKLIKLAKTNGNELGFLV